MMAIGRWSAVVDTQEDTSMDTTLTLQEVFNAVWERAKDKTKAVTDNRWADCLYRAKDGRKCFIGVLIPDAEYDPTMEGDGIIQIKSKLPCLQGLDVDRLNDLQIIHDAHPVEAWEEKLRDFALVYNLTVPN